MKFYVAYGSNLNKFQMMHRCPKAKPYAAGIIEGYELLFKGSKTGSYATIEPKVGASVPVGIWTIGAQEERALDRYEGFPTFYYKKEVEVKTNKGTLTAMVYIMHEDRPRGMPTDHYNRICMEGYDDFDLNKMDYYDALMTNFLRMEEQK